MGRRTGEGKPEKANPDDIGDEDEEGEKKNLNERQNWQIILGDKDENEKNMSAIRKKLGRTEQVR